MHDNYDDTVVIPGLFNLLSDGAGTSAGKTTYFSAPQIDLDIYDNIVVCMSGGKDSIACLLTLFDMGADRSRIELWHHDVDGREGSALMDWRFMASYNQKLAGAFGIPIFFSWLDGGFEGEMLKENSYSRPHKVETPDGLLTLERDKRRAKPGTRMRFPQTSRDLQTRWCSAALKIDVGRRALTNQSRFDGRKILFITGERRQESANRAKYNQLEPHTCDRARQGSKETSAPRRHVDAWRPVLHWEEERIWDAFSRYGVIAPVPYRLGWSRSSCMTCIFNDATIWATIGHYFPERLKAIAEYEKQFGITVSQSRRSVLEISRKAAPLLVHDRAALEQALSTDYSLPLFTSGKWDFPVGAFTGHGCGSV